MFASRSDLMPRTKPYAWIVAASLLLLLAAALLLPSPAAAQKRSKAAPTNAAPDSVSKPGSQDEGISVRVYEDGKEPVSKKARTVRERASAAREEAADEADKADTPDTPEPPERPDDHSNDLVRFGQDYEPKDVAIVAISANDPATHPDDRPEQLASEAKRLGYRFPVLFDESQEVAKAYRAACTPDFFVFDGKRRLVYRGQFDSSRPGTTVPVTGVDLRAAADAVLAGKPVSQQQKASLGCNIKWRAGNEPND